MDNADLHLILDIGRHAGQKGLEKAAEVIGNMDPSLRAGALGVACAILQHKINGLKTIGEGSAHHAAFHIFFDATTSTIGQLTGDDLKAYVAKTVAEEKAKREGG